MTHQDPPAGSSGPVEAKVKAATAAAVVTAFVLWLLSRYVFRGEVPAPVEGVVTLAVIGAATWLASYFAKHTPRPDLPAEER